MPTLYKEYTLPPGTFQSETFILSGFRQGVQAAPPAWFSFVDGAVIIGIHTYNGYEFTAPPALGTYDIYFDSFDLDATYYVRINVVIGAYSLFANCCGDRNIVWLGITGGWQNYVFTGVKTFTVDVGKDKQFKTQLLEAKYSEINDVYNGEIISTGDIPQAHVDALDGLKYSIQAFLLNHETGLWDIPILVDKGSFTKYKTHDKFFDVRIKFIYAEEILIQTQ